MAQVWIGLSRTLDFEQLICRYIDPLFCAPPPFSEVEEEEEPVGIFATSFGAEVFGPGSFEVYARSNYPNERFDYDLFERFAPFSAAAPGLREALAEEAMSMFFVICEQTPTKMADDNILITDVVEVQFDWEKPSPGLDPRPRR